MQVIEYTLMINFGGSLIEMEGMYNIADAHSQALEALEQGADSVGIFGYAQGWQMIYEKHLSQNDYKSATLAIETKKAMQAT